MIHTRLPRGHAGFYSHMISYHIRCAMKQKEKIKKSSRIRLIKKAPKDVAIMGAGWYGIHLALALRETGYKVVILEKDKDILSGTSGTFGIRTHTAGLHYPRSKKTRQICTRNYTKFCAAYSNLLVQNKFSIHALVKEDALGNASKVGLQTFQDVCREDKTCESFETEAHGYQGLLDAVTINEPSILVGEQLREILRSDLIHADIPFVCNYTVQKVEDRGNKITVIGDNGTEFEFDQVINATGFQSLLPENFKNNPFGLIVIYQPCLGLIYEDMMPDSGSFSFLALDGANPAIMPYVTGQYMVTHGYYTILASCDSPQEAAAILGRLTDDFVEQKIKTLTEQDILRYMPGFNQRFRYVGWKESVLAKPLTDTEFRCALTFSDPNRVIHAFPGKISSVFDTEQEVLALIKNRNCSERNGYRFVNNGVLADASVEIRQKPTGNGHNTCMSNPYPELYKRTPENRSTRSFFKRLEISDESINPQYSVIQLSMS
ncbi:MAG: FAD-dependent oxidoreductase [Legionellaceae bacterium]|nr:FAD-dependent oxidoreductase [Legionellaceae bacterium]